MKAVEANKVRAEIWRSLKEYSTKIDFRSRWCHLLQLQLEEAQSTGTMKSIDEYDEYWTLVKKIASFLYSLPNSKFIQVRQYEDSGYYSLEISEVCGKLLEIYAHLGVPWQFQIRSTLGTTVHGAKRKPCPHESISDALSSSRLKEFASDVAQYYGKIIAKAKKKNSKEKKSSSRTAGTRTYHPWHRHLPVVVRLLYPSLKIRRSQTPVVVSRSIQPVMK